MVDLNKYIKGNAVAINKTRGKILFTTLKPYLNNGDRILDFGCGYSPMAKHLIKNYELIGIDTDEDCVSYLSLKHPNGTWVSDSFYDYGDIDVLLFLSFVTDVYMFGRLNELVDNSRPRIILTDTNLRHRPLPDGTWVRNKKEGMTRYYVQMNLSLIKRGYHCVKSTQYIKNKNVESARYCQVWKRD